VPVAFPKRRQRPRQTVDWRPGPTMRHSSSAVTANASPAAHCNPGYAARFESRAPMHNLVVAVVSSRSLRIPDLLCEDLAKSRVTLRVAAGIRLVIGEHYSPVTAVKLDVTHAASLIAADDFEAIASCLRRAVQDADLQRKSAPVFIAKVARAFQLQQDSRELQVDHWMVCRSGDHRAKPHQDVAPAQPACATRPRGRFGAASGRVRELE
jgi:hypothetical protein